MGDEHEPGRRGFLVVERQLIPQARPPLTPDASPRLPGSPDDLVNQWSGPPSNRSNLEPS